MTGHGRPKSCPRHHHDLGPEWQGSQLNQPMDTDYSYMRLGMKAENMNNLHGTVIQVEPRFSCPKCREVKNEDL